MLKAFFQIFFVIFAVILMSQKACKKRREYNMNLDSTNGNSTINVAVEMYHSFKGFEIMLFLCLFELSGKSTTGRGGLKRSLILVFFIKDVFFQIKDF